MAIPFESADHIPSKTDAGGSFHVIKCCDVDYHIYPKLATLSNDSFTTKFKRKSNMQHKGKKLNKKEKRARKCKRKKDT